MTTLITAQDRARQKILDSLGNKSIQINITPKMLLQVLQWTHQQIVFMQNKKENQPMLPREFRRIEETIELGLHFRQRICDRFDIDFDLLSQAFNEEIW
jgi:hypothetical protein